MVKLLDNGKQLTKIYKTKVYKIIYETQDNAVCITSLNFVIAIINNMGG